MEVSTWLLRPAYDITVYISGRRCALENSVWYQQTFKLPAKYKPYNVKKTLDSLEKKEINYLL